MLILRLTLWNSRRHCKAICNQYIQKARCSIPYGRDEQMQSEKRRINMPADHYDKSQHANHHANNTHHLQNFTLHTLHHQFPNAKSTNPTLQPPPCPKTGTIGIQLTRDRDNLMPAQQKESNAHLPCPCNGRPA